MLAPLIRAIFLRAITQLCFDRDLTRMETQMTVILAVFVAIVLLAVGYSIYALYMLFVRNGRQ